MSVAFPPEIENFVAQEVSSGAYSSREELIVTAVGLLRQHQEDLARLRGDVAEGLEGEGIPADEVFSSLRAKYVRGQSSESP
jgi:putative addiction module CopG family antidote